MNGETVETAINTDKLFNVQLQLPFVKDEERKVIKKKEWTECEIEFLKRILHIKGSNAEWVKFKYLRAISYTRNSICNEDLKADYYYKFMFRGRDNCQHVLDVLLMFDVVEHETIDSVDIVKVFKVWTITPNFMHQDLGTIYFKHENNKGADVELINEAENVLGPNIDIMDNSSEILGRVRTNERSIFANGLVYTRCKNNIREMIMKED